jgi:hypothetical protein
MAFDIASTLIGLLVTIIIMIIFVVPALWISGRLLAGKQKAKFTDALWIVIIGTVVFYFINLFLTDLLSGFAIIIAYIVMLIIWLALVKHFFDCGWLKALAISIIAIIIGIIFMIIIAFVLAIIGIGAGWIPIPQQFNSF